MLFVKQDLEENWYTYENAKSCLMVVYTENNQWSGSSSISFMR